MLNSHWSLVKDQNMRINPPFKKDNFKLGYGSEKKGNPAFYSSQLWPQDGSNVKGACKEIKGITLDLINIYF